MIACIKCGKMVRGRYKEMCLICYRKYKQDISPKILCFCGCNEEIPSLNIFGEPMKYKKGHSSKGSNNPMYKGGISNDDDYILIHKPDHPFCRSNGFIAEHRLVYEYYLLILFDYDIYIPKKVDIDHINNNKKDNRIINLRPLYKSDHTKRHHEDRRQLRYKRICLWCNKSGKKIRWSKYGYNWICRNCNRLFNIIQDRYYNETKPSLRKYKLIPNINELIQKIS